MSIHADILPKDPASLEALVLSQRSEIEHLNLLVVLADTDLVLLATHPECLEPPKTSWS